jgi:hypothetical protein
MNIVGKSPQHSNIVFASFIKDSIPALDASKVYSLFLGEASKNSSFIDDTTMGFKIWSFPESKIRIIQEPGRIRIEDMSQKSPNESKIGEEAFRIISAFFEPKSFGSFGFNFDVYFRFDNVIPQREILKNFLSQDKMEDVSDFGWQFRLNSQKDKKKLTYFFKVISPLEIALHANVHYEKNAPSSAQELQEIFEKSYEDIDDIFNDLTF